MKGPVVVWPKWYSPPQSCNWRDTLNRVAAYYMLNPEDILGHRKMKHLIDARWVFAKALRVKGRLSYPQIGHIIGGRDHTTIIHACREFQHRAKYRPGMHEALHRALSV